jgi:hypothetical protein
MSTSQSSLPHLGVDRLLRDGGKLGGDGAVVVIRGGGVRVLQLLGCWVCVVYVCERERVCVCTYVCVCGWVGALAAWLLGCCGFVYIYVCVFERECVGGFVCVCGRG